MKFSMCTTRLKRKIRKNKKIGVVMLEVIRRRELSLKFLTILKGIKIKE